MSSKTKYTDYDGEPGCQTLEEVNKMYRNYWDPTAYWKCESQGKVASRGRCPTSELFMDTKGKCVHYAEWHWTEPTIPPSRPNK
ncbi:uncharacterized protein LOC119680255 [Teleopsis dalmanni]|uniref:uncharacterized protein LOC119680255 n=1 Tax=Teleopsis dalmanni TaxID=139649 RepID=UPI0018CDBD90|nr:uncharacterized protein LOC119680255 [Teleopsis dalmanni]